MSQQQAEKARVEEKCEGLQKKLKVAYQVDSYSKSIIAGMNVVYRK